MTDVLVVDDSDFIRTFMESLCAEQGWQVRAVGSIAEARDALAERSPRIVVLDYHLPDGHGVDLIDFIRGREPTPQIIGLSMQPRKHVHDQFGRADVDLVFDKETILRDQLAGVLREQLA